MEEIKKKIAERYTKKGLYNRSSNPITNIKSYLDVRAKKIVNYLWKQIHKRKKKYYIKKYGLEALDKLYQIAINNNIPIWLDFGTLLGSYREKSFIPHDDDIDTSMYLKDFTYKIEKEFYNNGFNIIRFFKLRNRNNPNHYILSELTLNYKGLQIDLFFYEINGDKRTCHSFDSGINNEWTAKEISFPISSFVSIYFMGIKCMTPSNQKECLEYCYGKNFMIPDPNYSGSDKEKSISPNLYYGEMIGGWSH